MPALRFFVGNTPSDELDVMLQEAALLIDKFNSSIPEGSYDIFVSDDAGADNCPASTVYKDSWTWLANRTVGVPCEGSYILLHRTSLADGLFKLVTWPGLTNSAVVFLASELYHELVHL